MRTSKLNSLTVAELRGLLEGEDDDAVVLFTCDYGDYLHTKQALPISGDIEEHQVEESAYSHSGWALADVEVDADDDHVFLAKATNPNKCRVCGGPKDDEIHETDPEDDKRKDTRKFLVIS
jgi:hypothetical protein